MKTTVVLSDRVRIAAAYYIGSHKTYSFPLPFFILAMFAACCMLVSEVVARTRRKKISPTPATSNGNQGKNMVISNLIPFTKLNLIVAFDFVFGAIIKLFEPTQVGVPNLSIHMNVMLLLLVSTNREARRHAKRKLASWRGTDFVEDVQEQPAERGQESNPSRPRNIHISNQMYQENIH